MKPKILEAIVPVGGSIWYTGNTIPSGYLLCDGSAVSRTTYSRLFEAIGTTYGSGDGSTTFNLPNLIDKFIQGSATAGTVKEAGLPDITGNFSMLVGNNASIAVQGGYDAFYSGSAYGYWASGIKEPTSGAANTHSNVFLDASRSSSIYGNSTTVQPPAVTLLPCIKY